MLLLINLFLLPPARYNFISTNFFFPLLNKLFLGSRAYSQGIFLPLFDRPIREDKNPVGMLNRLSAYGVAVNIWL